MSPSPALRLSKPRCPPCAPAAKCEPCPAPYAQFAQRPLTDRDGPGAIVYVDLPASAPPLDTVTRYLLEGELRFLRGDSGGWHFKAMRIAPVAAASSDPVPFDVRRDASCRSRAECTVLTRRLHTARVCGPTCEAVAVSSQWHARLGAFCGETSAAERHCPQLGGCVRAAVECVQSRCVLTRP